MGDILKDLTTIVTLIIMVAIVGLLVSKQSNAGGIINSASSAFNSGLATAQGAVTGYSPGPPIYASQGGTNFGAAIPAFESGAGFNTLAG